MKAQPDRETKRQKNERRKEKYISNQAVSKITNTRCFALFK